MFCGNLSPNMSGATYIGLILLFLFFSLVSLVVSSSQAASEHSPLCSHLCFPGLFPDLLASLPASSFSFMQLIGIIY